MSTTIEAAAAATIIQLLTNDYGVDVRWRFSGAAWQAAITHDGTIYTGRSYQVLAAFVEASCKAEENVGTVLATLEAVPLTAELGDAWRLLAAIASEFDFVSLEPAPRDNPEVPIIRIKANAHELGVLEVMWLVRDDALNGWGLVDALTRLEGACQLSQQTTDPAPALRGNDIAPTSGTIEA